MGAPWENYAAQESGPWSKYEEQKPASIAAPSNFDVVKNAAYKGVANIPDAFLNTPSNLWNLSKAATGSIAVAAGHPEYALDPTPAPDYARHAMEGMGLIDPKIEPQGAKQKVIDAITQGTVGGALTGGTSIPKALIGAGMGGLSSGAAQTTESLTKSPNAGIAAGLVAPALVAKALGGKTNVSPNIQLLKDEGVQMTPGQIMGGTAQRIEDSVASIPYAGDVIKSAQRRSLESFGTAAMNRALEPIGEKLPSNLKGNEAISYVQDKLGSRYDDLLSKMKGSLNGPSGLQTELNNIQSMGQNLPPLQRDQLARIIKNEITDRFTSSGLASGDTIKNIQSKLGKMASDFSRSDNYDNRTLGGAVAESKAALDRMIEAENPAHAADLAKVNEGYANFKRIQNASASVGSKEGVFTPSQLQNSVKSQDKSKDKSRFARGEALMQDLSNAGKDVLSRTVPDSGTPTRALVEAAAVGGLGHFSPIAAGTTLGAMSVYSPIGQKIAQSILLGGQGTMLRDAAKKSILPLSSQENEKQRRVIDAITNRQ